MGHIEALPEDVVMYIFSMLEQRDACALGSASKGMSAVHECTPKAVTVRGTDDAMGAARFVDRHAESVYRLFSRCKIVNYFVLPRIAQRFSSLRHLKLSWSSVPDCIAKELPPSLETLYVRRMVPSRGRQRGGNRLFSTSSLDRVTSLKHVSIWFSAMYDEIRFDHHSKFSTVFVSAPTYVTVEGSPPGPRTSLRIDCNAIWFHDGGGVLELAPKTGLKTIDFSIPMEIFAHSTMRDVASLSYECPSRSWVPHLGEMTNLKRLFVTLDNPVAQLADFAHVQGVEELVVRARYSFGVDDDPAFGGFGAGSKVSVFVNGVYSPFNSASLVLQ